MIHVLPCSSVPLEGLELPGERRHTKRFVSAATDNGTNNISRVTSRIQRLIRNPCVPRIRAA